MRTKTIITRVTLVALVALLLLGVTSASAAIGPKWTIHALSSTTAAPGEEFEIIGTTRNVGDGETNGEIVLTVALPVGLTAQRAILDPVPDLAEEETIECTAGNGVSLLPDPSDPTDVKCVNFTSVRPKDSGGAGYQRLRLRVKADQGAKGTLSAVFAVSGGGDPIGDSTVDPITIAPEPLPFGVDAFDNRLLDDSGEPSTLAGAHPADLIASIEWNSYSDPAPLKGTATPVEPLKDAFVDLPPGLVGNPTALDTCTLAQLARQFGDPPLCPSTSQVGTFTLLANGHRSRHSAYGPNSLFNMEAPVGAPARFGFNVLGTAVILDAAVRSDGDYGITTGSRNVSEGISLAGSIFDFWGDPASSVHDEERACPGGGPPSLSGTPCPTQPGTPERAFFRNPTSCQGPVPYTLRTDSYFHPGDFAEETIFTHHSPGYPLPAGPSTFPEGYVGPEERGVPYGFEGCKNEPFSPSLEAAPPTGSQAAQPSSFAFDLAMPQQGLEEADQISESDLRTVEVTLPRGLRLNPSSADGLGACSPAQVALTTPVGQADADFETEKTACPEDSKIGNVSIKTPLLDHELSGAVYLAQQGQNPFGSLLALYLVIQDTQSGVDIVLPGKVSLDASTGQITTVFDENPQLPFEALHLELFSGPRAPLTLPDNCATYTTHATFAGWSGKVVSQDSIFKVEKGCASGAFDPQLDAGTQNPLAGAYSPFHLRLSRADGSQRLGGLRLKLPQGLLANLSGVAYCPDSVLGSISKEVGTGGGEVSHPSCPPGSRLGTVTVGAGSGPTPFYTSLGRVYWAGPYKGMPVSVAAVVPALAGPFDLGTVVVRNGFEVNPDTAEITAVSDPLPSILEGIPLDLRDVRVDLDRPDYTLNPTSCEPKTLAVTLTSTTGATAERSQRFQVSGCERLGFKPKLSLRLKGAVHRRAHPSLIANLTARAGDANIASAQVKLPPAAFLDNGHIGTVCTRPQFAAHACPPDSVYGTVSATSPILGYPLSGNAYLRSSDHPLPDLVADLRGPDSQPIEIALAGKTDSVKGALRNTFEVVPDAPVTKFRLQLFGGKRGLIEMSSGFCAHPNATVNLDGQNGRAYDTTPKVRAKCGARKRHGKPRARGGHR